MKLLNTKDLKKLLEEGALDFQDIFGNRDEDASPCREIKVEDRRVILLVDRHELMSQSFEQLGIQALTMEQVNTIMFLWREGKMESLRQYLKLPLESE